MLQEKKVSSKINYDVLKSLTASKTEKVVEQPPQESSTVERLKRQRTVSSSSSIDMPPPKRGRAPVNINAKRSRSKMQAPIGLPFVEDVKDEPKKEEPEELDLAADDEDYEDDYEEPTESEMGVLQMLRQHQQNETDETEAMFEAGLADEDY
ncbi:hypothetical protein ILUMI_11344 [Ignelater luminosus]|uniref:Uncharacterized protein n=1 Tax=Ignelater luminosus TaxID=2038154 RepID=A0A8K0CW90_IGNLU|nr:hypothetical protein ILUMI_11344 [Ignelater luminosus]